MASHAVRACSGDLLGSALSANAEIEQQNILKAACPNPQTLQQHRSCPGASRPACFPKGSSHLAELAAAIEAISLRDTCSVLVGYLEVIDNQHQEQQQQEK